jgi:osmoprotectant transport system permease protein
MPTLPRWVHRLRPFAVPIWVAIGILVSIGVYQTLTGRRFDFEVLNAPNLTSETIQHVFVSGVSFALVAGIGVPLGVLMAQAGRAVRVPVFVLANLGQAIPGIGLLVLLFAILGLGVAPTVVALVVYGLLPVLRNTVAGIQSVDPAAVDAARGMGMTRWQALVRVQLPLASPLVFAGLRTALVLIIGTATLGNFIGGGGLGDVIAAGINNSDQVVFVGAVMVASLALLADWGLSIIERLAVPKQVSD